MRKRNLKSTLSNQIRGIYRGRYLLKFYSQNLIKMGNHGDFKAIEQSRPKFEDSDFVLSQIPDPDWVPGSGANSSEWKEHKKIIIDPYETGRPSGYNYKTLISAIVPRPIGFLSTIGKDGSYNLAPFSYFSLALHDPPTFTVSFSPTETGSKDTAKNLLETKECTISIISEWFVEAANHTAINSPYGVDEWELSGLTKADSETVKPPHVAESAFSIEGRVIHDYELTSVSDPANKSNHIFIIQGINFHVREDVINEDKNALDLSKLKPVSRLGGITYGRTISGYEKPRFVYTEESADAARKVSGS